MGDRKTKQKTKYIFFFKRRNVGNSNTTDFFRLCSQEMIQEKVREDVMVRTKISQSSALRQKRGHSAVNQQPGVVETEPLLGLNNNEPAPQKQKNGPVHANGSTGGSQNIFEQLEEEEEEESLSTESPSDMSKFES